MRTVVAHPYRMVGEAISCVLSRVEDLEIVGVATTSAEVIEVAQSLGAEVIVVSGLFVDPQEPEIIRSIKSWNQAVSIVLIAGTPTSTELFTLLKAGITGYVTLDRSAKQLIEAMSKIKSGELVLSGVDRLGLSEDEKQSPDPGGSSRVAVESLTPREREVLSLLSKGFSNRQIADDLYLSEHTVRTHVQNLRAKLNVRSKFEAAMVTMRAGGTATVGAVGGRMRF